MFPSSSWRAHTGFSINTWKSQFFSHSLRPTQMFLLTNYFSSLIHEVTIPSFSLQLYSGQILWLARPFWTMSLILKILQLVAPENTWEHRNFLSAPYCLSLSCWSIIWQEISIIVSSKSFRLLLVLEENMRMSTSPAQGRENTRIRVG